MFTHLQEKFIKAKIEEILERDMPLELRAERIYSEVVVVVSDSIRDNYERLFYFENNPNNLAV